MVGSKGTAAPAQILVEAPKLNTGVTTGLTVTAREVGRAHCPAPGVNVYVAEFWLSIAEGLHVPVTPLLDVVGRAGTPAPAQTESEVPKLNEGVIFGFTVTLNEAVVAH